jgi:cysteine desulfurase
MVLIIKTRQTCWVCDEATRCYYDNAQYTVALSAAAHWRKEALIYSSIQKKPTMAVYLDCAATTPLDPRVRDEVLRYLDEDFGNAGSRSHAYGQHARRAVEWARDRVAAVVDAQRGDVVFTSGATESNNLAILGLADCGAATRRRHIVTTAIEHHAVLEPIAELVRRGFQVDRVAPDAGGAVDPEAVLRLVRPDTLLVSMMHVNNETGVIQPIDQVATGLQDRDVVFHVDAAQGFGKDIGRLQHRRIDLVSVSGHKIHAPKGVGALIARKRDGARPPVNPLMFGGGQERGWRPGTLPVPLIAGIGKAAELALQDYEPRARRCAEFRAIILEGLAPLRPVVNADLAHTVSNILNIAIPGVDAEDAIEAWQDLVAISHGAACTSQSYTCSHVLSAMNLAPWRQDGALRLSWCHFTEVPDLAAMVGAIERVRVPAADSR